MVCASDNRGVNMSRLLTPAEMVLLEINTGYLSQGIPVYGSRVLIWAENNDMPVLIYHTLDQGYVLTDISDLGASVIAELGRESEIHGFWYYLPQSIQEVLAEKAESAIDVVKQAGLDTAEMWKAAAAAIGETIAQLIRPLIKVDTLLIPLIVAGVIAIVYLKKG